MLKIRDVAPEDAAPLSDLLNDIIRAGGTTAIETEMPPAALDAAYLSGPNVHFCLVVEIAETGQLDGFQTIGNYSDVPDGWCDIATFARRGGTQKGIGTALFAETRERVKALGFKGIIANIRGDNEGGLTYYSRMGFEDYAVREGVPLTDGTPVDRVTKRLTLG